MMKTLIITGGIGSGKSLLCRYLAEKGIPVYDADSRTKALYDRCPEMVEAIEAEFCCFLRDANGRLDRQMLGEIVFRDRGKLEILESIVHPEVRKDFMKWRRSYEGKVPFVVMESAIAQMKPEFEELADALWIVEASQENRLKRACSRDAQSADKIIERMKMQRFYPERADAVIHNDSDEASLYAEADKALTKSGLIIN